MEQNYTPLNVVFVSDLSGEAALAFPGYPGTPQVRQYAESGPELFKALQGDMCVHGFRVGAVSFGGEAGVQKIHPIIDDPDFVHAYYRPACGTLGPTVQTPEGLAGGIEAGVDLLRSAEEDYKDGQGMALVILANVTIAETDLHAAASAIIKAKDIFPQLRVILLYPDGMGMTRFKSWYTALFTEFWYLENFTQMEEVARAFLFRQPVPVPEIEAQAVVSGGAGMVLLTANPKGSAHA